MSISCVARAVELCVAEIEHDVDADHRNVGDVEPGGVGEGAALLPGPDLAVEAEAVADDDEPELLVDVALVLDQSNPVALV